MNRYVYLVEKYKYELKSLLIATEEEVTSFKLAQESNRFLSEDKILSFNKIGVASDNLIYEQLLKFGSEFESISFSEKVNCDGLNFSGISRICCHLLSIGNNSFFNNESLSSFPNVNELVLGRCVNVDIDLNRFKNINILRIIEWNAKIHLRGNSSVKVATIGGYKPGKFSSLEPLSAIDEIEKLELNKTSLLDLKGINKFKNIKKLEVRYATKLENIGAISELNNLMEVSFEACKKIKDFSQLSKCNKLTSITIYNCNIIDDINFLKYLKHLNRLVVLGTKIKNFDKEILSDLHLSECSIN